MEELTPGAERLQTVLNILNINGNKLYKILGYKNPSSIYQVLEGVKENISPQLAERIVKEFPQFNYMYLTKGEPPVTLDKQKQITNQVNLLGRSAAAEELEINTNDIILITLRKLLHETKEIRQILEEKYKNS